VLSEAARRAGRVCAPAQVSPGASDAEATTKDSVLSLVARSRVLQRQEMHSIVAVYAHSCYLTRKPGLRGSMVDWARLVQPEKRGALSDCYPNPSSSPQLAIHRPAMSCAMP
jgi:hypothetical protein